MFRFCLVERFEHCSLVYTFKNRLYLRLIPASERFIKIKNTENMFMLYMYFIILVDYEILVHQNQSKLKKCIVMIKVIFCPL